VPRGDRPDEGGVPPRPARVHHVPPGATAAQDHARGVKPTKPRTGSSAEVPCEGHPGDQGEAGEERPKIDMANTARSTCAGMPLSHSPEVEN